jgi:hypothetical protein
MDPLLYLKQNVFPGESGGDYNALFGYANRPGGQFGGVNLTDMTVDQALAFSDPSGPYGQWVKGQVGRVATPMGAYQIVGTTLRGAKEGLGLTGSERMTPELQDQLGMWIYQNQGPGAWEAWGKGGGGGTVVASTKGGAPMGLLSDEEPKTFGDRLKQGWKSGELMDSLAMAFNSMRLRPDANLGEIIGRRQDTRQKSSALNRTAQWLAANGRQDLAEAMVAGGLSGQDAMSIFYTPPKEPDQVGQTVDAAQLRTMFPGATIEDGLYNVKPDGTISKVGGGGTTVNVGGGESELGKKLAGEEAAVLGTFLKAGPVASATLGDLQMLDEVLQFAPQGPLSGTVASAFPGISTAGAAAQSIIKRVAPTLRVEGSGSTSDVEYAGMLESLPSLSNYPEANAAISGMMKAKAQINIERANIVRAFQNTDQGPEAAAAMRAALTELDNRSIMTPELRRLMSGLGGGTPTTTPGGARCSASTQMGTRCHERNHGRTVRRHRPQVS